MFVHVSSHCFECIKILFSAFCKTVYFGMSITQKLAGKGHTSPGKTFAEKKEVYHCSTTFTCRVSGHRMAVTVQEYCIVIFPSLFSCNHSQYAVTLYF